MGASNEACFATLWKSPASRRKLTGIATFGLRKWLCIWLGLLDLLLVALIIKVSSATCNAYNHCLSSQILPKYGKIHPKSREIILRSVPKSLWDPKCIPNVSRMCFFSILGNFLKANGSPKSRQNRQKTQKSAKRSKLKKLMFFNTFVSRFVHHFGLRKWMQKDVFFDICL